MLEEKLRALRRKNNLNQKQMSDIFNVATGTIGMWETGKRKPDIDMLKKIAKYFNVSIDYLLKEEEYTTIQAIGRGKEKEEIKITNETFKELFEENEQLTQEEIKKLKKFLKNLKD